MGPESDPSSQQVTVTWSRHESPPPTHTTVETNSAHRRESFPRGPCYVTPMPCWRLRREKIINKLPDRLSAHGVAPRSRRIGERRLGFSGEKPMPLDRERSSGIGRSLPSTRTMRKVRCQLGLTFLGRRVLH